MKRLVALAVGGILSASLIAGAYAAPAVAPDRPKPSKGMQNAKKVMQHRIDHEKKMIQVRKKAQAKKHQAQGM